MSLKHYMELAYKEVFLGWPEVLRTIENIDVQLKTDSDNLILLYGGSFNPPHRGHVDVINSALRPEAGVSAVVILPCEDYLLQNKMVNNPSNFFLDRQRRAAIWQSVDSVPTDRVWVWTNTFFPFKAFIEALVRTTGKDGYPVAFSHLIGPDNLRMHDPLMILPFVCNRIFLSNKARHISTQFLPDKTPTIWGGFGEWTRSKYTSKETVNGDDRDRVVLWTCNGADDSNPDKKGYYLEFEKPNAVDINSTDLRESLTKIHRLEEIGLEGMSTEVIMSILKDVL